MYITHAAEHLVSEGFGDIGHETTFRVG